MGLDLGILRVRKAPHPRTPSLTSLSLLINDHGVQAGCDAASRVLARVAVRWLSQQTHSCLRLLAPGWALGGSC